MSIHHKFALSTFDETAARAFAINLEREPQDRLDIPFIHDVDGPETPAAERVFDTISAALPHSLRLKVSGSIGRIVSSLEPDRCVEVVNTREPKEYPWSEENIDVVIDAFPHQRSPMGHAVMSSGKVLWTPPQDRFPALFRGLNDDAVNPDEDIYGFGTPPSRALARILTVVDSPEFQASFGQVEQIEYRGSEATDENDVAEYPQPEEELALLFPKLTKRMRGVMIGVENLFHENTMESSLVNVKLTFAKPVKTPRKSSLKEEIRPFARRLTGDGFSPCHPPRDRKRLPRVYGIELSPALMNVAGASQVEKNVLSLDVHYNVVTSSANEMLLTANMIAERVSKICQSAMCAI